MTKKKDKPAHNPHAMKNYKFTPEKQEAYLSDIRKGLRDSTAAKAVGVDTRTPRNFAERNPDFAERLELAHEEAADPVEQKLYDAALDGEPWAVNKWLEANSKRWRPKAAKLEISGEVIHSIEGAPLDKLLALQERAIGREEALQLTEHIEDAEIVEEEEEEEKD